MNITRLYEYNSIVLFIIELFGYYFTHYYSGFFLNYLLG